MRGRSLYVVIGVLAVIAAGLAGYILYQETQKPSLEIRVDEQGISIDGNS